MTFLRRRTPLLIVAAGCALLIAACGSSSSTATESIDATSEAQSTVATPLAETSPLETPPLETTPIEAPAVATPVAETPAATAEPEPTVDDSSAETATEIGSTTTFVAEVWADNWFGLWANGEFVGEDSVPITTERSFNAETVTFEASYPLTIALQAKDFKETDSGLEYIGEGNQQMGDGGIIVQITDLATGEIVAVSDGSWDALVVHRAPLNVECENSADPDTECQFEIIETPSDWAEPAFGTSAWASATEWSEAAVSPKDGYNEIAWDPAAQLIWGSDLEVDNTILLRTTIDG